MQTGHRVMFTFWTVNHCIEFSVEVGPLTSTKRMDLLQPIAN